MTDMRWQQSLRDWGNALNRLEEMLNEPIDAKPYVLDATIHRFEFCYELCWKTLKYLLAHEGKTDINSPREVFKAAYSLHWIDNEELWIDMINSRNLTTHTYRESTAQEVYDDITSFYPALRNTYVTLQKKYEN